MAVTPMVAARKPSFRTRAWRRLRLAVLWARRGGATHSLRLLRTLRRHGGMGSRGDRLRYYGERQFSIDETPAFRFRTPSARVLRLIPCITPSVPDTPGLYGDVDRYFFSAAVTRGWDDEGGEAGAGTESVCDDEEQLLERAMAEARRASTAAEEGGGDAGVDVKADEFIARFYAQMKLQRQISWLQSNEMMEKSIS